MEELIQFTAMVLGLLGLLWVLLLLFAPDSPIKGWTKYWTCMHRKAYLKTKHGIEYLCCDDCKLEHRI